MARHLDNPRSATRYWRPALIVLGLAAAAVLGIGYLTRAKPVSVTLWTVARGPVEAAVANTRAGTVKACRRAKLAPAVGGEISRLLVREGDRVAQGQPLLALWNKDLIARRRLAEKQLLSARLHAEEACALAEAAERDAGRARALRRSGFISLEGLDKAVFQAKARHAACHAANADTAQAAAGVAVIAAELERTVLRAPFAGVVAEVNGEQGEFTTPSPPGIPTLPAVDLIDDRCLYVTAPIDEVDAPAIRVGMPARITLDAFPGRHFAGRVRRIAPYVLDVEKQARTVDVEVAFDHPAKAKTLLVGYSADAEIILETHDHVLRVPTQALLESGRVLLYRPDGILEARRVKTGLSNWQYTEIMSGLAVGDRVVSSPEQKGIKAGVRAVPTAPDAAAP